MNTSHWSALCTLALGVSVATSSALAQPQFPRDIQAGIAAGTATIPVLVFSGDEFKVYSYVENSTLKYLFEYQLYPTSNESTHSSSTSLGGAAWFGFSGVIQPSEPRHDVWLYLDLVVPTPTNLWIGDSDGLDVRLNLTTADLLAGTAYLEIRDSILGDLHTIGDTPVLPFIGQSFVPCLAASCAVGAQVNLLHAEYQMAGPEAVLTINPTESRTVLYHQWRDYLYDPTWFRSQTYAIVPEPSSLALVTFVVLAAGSVRRSASRMTCRRQET